LNWKGPMSGRSSEGFYTFENKGGNIKIEKVVVLTPLNISAHYEPHGFIGPGGKGKIVFSGATGTDLGGLNSKFELHYRGASGNEEFKVITISNGKLEEVEA